ncbi:MAG: GFA family protein [Pseudomonadales bacterium]
MAEDAQQHSGGCACGAVRYIAQGSLRPVIACHCEQCRRTSGHFVAATAVRRDRFTFDRDESLVWFAAVEGFRRGFCQQCGSSLFFEEVNGDRISIAAGSLDDASGLSIAAHIFTDEAASYYELPKNPNAFPVCSPDGQHNIRLPD